MKPTALFVSLALGFGIIFSLVTAPFHAPDESRHYLRVFSYAMGSVWQPHIMPRGVLAYNEKADARAWDLYYRKRDATRPLYTLDELREVIESPLNKDDSFLYDPLSNIAFVYSPVGYAPGILAMAAGYAAEATPGMLLYMARLAQMLTGVAVIALALRLLPVMQWSLCLVSLIPMTVFMRSAITTDTLATGFALLLFALVMQHVAGARVAARKDVILMSGVALLLGLCKSGYFLLPGMVLLIPPTQFRSRIAYGWTIAAVFVLPAIVSLGWSLAASMHIVQQGSPQGTSATEQLHFILSQPFDYVLTLLRTICSWEFIKNMVDRPLIGALGSLDRPIPHAVTYPYTVGLVLILLSQGLNGWQPMRWQRLLAGGIFTGTICIILTLLYLQFTPVGHGKVIGFQGRYLYPILPLLVVALLPARGLSKLAFLRNHIAAAIATLSVLGLGFGVWVMISKDYAF